MILSRPVIPGFSNDRKAQLSPVWFMYRLKGVIPVRWAPTENNAKYASFTAVPKDPQQP